MPDTTLQAVAGGGKDAPEYQQYLSDINDANKVRWAGDPNWVNPAYGGPAASPENGWTTVGSGVPHIQNYDQAAQAYQYEMENNPDFAATLGEYWQANPGIDRLLASTKFDALDWYARDAQRELAHPDSSFFDSISGFLGPIAGLIGGPVAGALVGGLSGGLNGGGILGGLTGALGGYGAGGGNIFGSVKNALGFGTGAGSGAGAWTGLANQGFPGGAAQAFASGGGGWGPLASAGATLANQAPNFLQRGNQVPGISTGVTTPTGGGLVGSGQLNPAGVGIQGGAGLSASPLAAAGTAGVVAAPGVTDLQQYFGQQIPGTNQQLGDPLTSQLQGGGNDSWLDGLKDMFGPGDLLSAFSGQEDEGGAGPESGFGLGGIGAGAQPMAMMQQQQRQQPMESIIDPLMNASAEEGMMGGGIDYETEKLQPGPNMRLPGYQTQPFGNALADSNQLFQQTR